MELKKTWGLAVMLLFALCSCNKESKFVVTGTLPIDGFSGRMVYLKCMKEDMSGLVEIDSTRIVGNAFTFEGTAPAKAEGRYIEIGKEGVDNIAHSLMLFVPEAGRVTFSINSDYEAKLTSDTPLNKRLGSLMGMMNEEVGKQRAFIDSLHAAGTDLSEVTFPEEFVKQAKLIGDSAYAYLLSIAGTPFFDEMFFRMGYIVSPEQAKELQAYAGDRIKRKREASEKAARSMGKAKTGEAFFDLTATDVNGKKVPLSGYAGKGKVVLLDFWASWCGPCIQEIPLLKELHAKYKDRGFEIISISIEGDNKAWKKAVKKQQMNWPQLASKEAARVYGISSIPYTVLLDGDGTVVSKNIHGESVAAEVERLLK